MEVLEGYYAFEIIMADNITKSDARHLKNLEDILDKKLISSFVLSNDPETADFGGNIFGVNAAMFLG